MTTGPRGGPPPVAPSAGGGRGTATQRSWWIVAALAGLVCIALIVWLVVFTSGEEPPAPPPSRTQSSAPVDRTPTTEPPTATAGDEWGEFPPKNLDSLKDLSEADFPDRVNSYVFDKEDRSPYSVIADYSDPETYRTMSATLDFDTAYYAKYLASLTDVAYYGNAVCGFSQGTFVQPSCVMVGNNEMLEVGTADDGATLADLAAFIEELYGAL